MKVILNKNKNLVKFSELKPGDTFIDPDRHLVYEPEMKIEYGDIYCQFSETGDTASGFASVSLETGNVFFYDDDFYVIPIKLNAVEE
jgi:hypothetical protein